MANRNFTVRGTYPAAHLALYNSSLHIDYPPAFTTKSYTLQNPLGNNSTPSQSICSALLLDHKDDSLTNVKSPSEPMISMYDELSTDSLPYSHPASFASLSYSQVSPLPQATQDGLVLGSPLFIHDASSETNSGRDEWDDTSTCAPRAPRFIVPSQSYMLRELPSPASFSQSLSQQYPSSLSTRSHRRHSQSPPPRSPLRLSPAPNTKRSLYKDKKPALACLFCRKRKIACRPLQPGSKDKTSGCR